MNINKILSDFGPKISDNDMLLEKIKEDFIKYCIAHYNKTTPRPRHPIHYYINNGYVKSINCSEIINDNNFIVIHVKFNNNELKTFRVNDFELYYKYRTRYGK